MDPIKNDSASSCCGGDKTDVAASSVESESDIRWPDIINTSVGDVPIVTTKLTFGDTLARWKLRWGVKRMASIVTPGLYAVGSPDENSPVLVSANYKMSFDHLRSQLGGVDAWIIVLDTKGINVWCAAGKGTFGTEELVDRIETTGIGKIVSHRKLIVPQLGAPGVCAHTVKQKSGFKVIYGPVRAKHIQAFLDANMEATKKMRRVEFPLKDRVILGPVELVGGIKYILIAMAVFIALSGLGSDGYSISRVLTIGGPTALLLFAGYLFGVVCFTALLPILPGRAFSVKGLWVGVLYMLAAVGIAFAFPGIFGGALNIGGLFYILIALTSYIAMNFTGASTYTSLSGVKREMKFAVPLQIGSLIFGLVLWIGGLFIPI